MSTIVFIGPTLTPAQAHEHLDAQYLPPAQQGDIYLAATRHKPRAIGLIDGRFDQVDAVAHKEILWAMAQGIHVYGAASMGALRAAELHVFGMLGVGTIFEHYRDAMLIDDDEVAVAHATEEHDYRALSTAMVDIRATVAEATRIGTVTIQTGEALIALAKQSFYLDRCYPTLIQQACDAGLNSDEVSAFRLFLKDGRVHQKRRDAIDMLAFMQRQSDAQRQPKSVTYAFSHTDAWHSVVQRATKRATAATQSISS